MIYSNYPFTLDIHGVVSQISFPVSLNDTARSLLISLTDGGRPYEISHGCRAVLAAVKPDGTRLLNDCIIVGNKIIRYDFTPQTASFKGKIDCEVRLYGEDGNLVTSPRFTIVVYEGLLDERIVSEDEKTTINNMLVAEQLRVAAENERVAAEAEREEVAKRAEAAADRVKESLNGDRVYIRYSAYPDGEGYVSEWARGLNYIGVAAGLDEPTDKSGYEWSIFAPTVYVGSGDMPDYADIQIDPNGEDDLPIDVSVIEKLTVKGQTIINEGIASGEHSIAGGTTDKNFIESLIGQLGSNLLKLNPSEAIGPLSISLGADNKALSGASLAMGYDNISGCKGYYFDTIDFENKTIKLSKTRRASSLISPSYPDSIGWQKGDILFIVNGDKYFLEIANVSGNTVEVKNLPFSSISYSSVLSVYTYSKPNDRTVVNLNRPTDGVVTLGWGAFGIGAQNVVTGSNALALGYKNVVAGDFGAAFGQENEVGYSGFAAGIMNKAKGKAAFSAGDNNEANGFASSAEGYYTRANSNVQHVQGKYNIVDNNEKYAHIVGNGKSEETRSNAHTLDWDGNAWFAGLITSFGGVVCGTQGGQYTAESVSGYYAIRHASNDSPYKGVHPKIIVLSAKAKDASDESCAFVVYDNRANFGLRITNNLTSGGGVKVDFVRNAVWTSNDFKGYIMLNPELENGLSKSMVFRALPENANYNTYYTVIY